MPLMKLKEREYVVQRSPTLNTVLMVEETIKNANGLMTLSELKRLLPKQVMHQTLVKILDYLEYSGKIYFNEKGILWIRYDNKKLQEARKTSIKVR